MLTRHILCLLLFASSTPILAAPFPQDKGDRTQEPGPTPAPSPLADTIESISASFSDLLPSLPAASASAPAPAGLTGEVISDVPLSCIAGCSLSQTLYEDCVGNDNPSCTRFCTTANYTQALTCLSCLTVQGSLLSTDQLQGALNAYTKVCKRVQGSRFRGTPSLTAGATTTEGTSTSLREGAILPKWSGFRIAENVAVPTDVGSLGQRISWDRQG